MNGHTEYKRLQETDLEEGLVAVELQGRDADGKTVAVPFDSSGKNIISKTFTELKGLATANELVKGQKYRITDYMTTYTQPVTNATKSSGIIEVLQLTAITTNSFATECRSELYPQDIVYYDINDATEGFTKGKIFRRIDTLRNNDIGTDWRHVKYDRSGVDKLLFRDYTVAKNNTIKETSLFNCTGAWSFKDNFIDVGLWKVDFPLNMQGNKIGQFFINNVLGDGFDRNDIKDYVSNKTFPVDYQYRTVYGNSNVFPTNTSAEKMLVIDPITKELSEKLIPTGGASSAVNKYSQFFSPKQLIAWDNFDRANETSIVKAESGQLYSAWKGIDIGKIENKVYKTNSATILRESSMLLTIPETKNIGIEFGFMRTTSGHSSTGISIVKDLNNYFFFGRFSNATNSLFTELPVSANYQLIAVIAGVATVLGSVSQYGVYPNNSGDGFAGTRMTWVVRYTNRGRGDRSTLVVQSLDKPSERIEVEVTAYNSTFVTPADYSKIAIITGNNTTVNSYNIANLDL